MSDIAALRGMDILPLVKVSEIIRTATCPHCSAVIGLESRCHHVRDLLSPAENGGQWAIVVSEKPSQVRVINQTSIKLPAKPRTSGQNTNAVREAVAAGFNTSAKVHQRIGCGKRFAATILHRLWMRKELQVVGLGGTTRKSGRPAKVYRITKLGRQRLQG